MKTEDEARQALAALRWYRETGGFDRQDVLTRQNLIGCLAALEWLLGLGEDGPLALTLEELAKYKACYQKIMENN